MDGSETDFCSDTDEDTPVLIWDDESDAEFYVDPDVRLLHALDEVVDNPQLDFLTGSYTASENLARMEQFKGPLQEETS